MSPYLIIGIGNPSRGDDALGSLMVERLEALGLPDVDLLTDFQLQVEYALDLQGRSAVIFVDAALSGAEPFEFTATQPAEDDSYSSHAMSPSALLHACHRLFGPPPAAHTLAIRGYQFDLGTALSSQARHNLDAASDHLLAYLSRARIPD